MLALTLVTGLALGQGYAPLRQGMDPLDAQREERVQRLGKQFRCAVCQGVAIADSPASMARAQLDKVRELVLAGKTDAEIEDYMVERYGEWVLLKPRRDGSTSLLWILPLMMLGGGFLILLTQVKKKPKVVASAPATLSEPAPDEYLDKVRADLGKNS